MLSCTSHDALTLESGHAPAQYVGRPVSHCVGAATLFRSLVRNVFRRDEFISSVPCSFVR
jgi:hypothetical protein